MPFKQLRLSLQEKMLYVQKLIRLPLRPIALAKEEVTNSAVRRLIYEAGKALEDLRLLCRAGSPLATQKTCLPT
jgi:poly(A) polymerase